eukprot:CAMPEP_0203927230 /NCGR_PEP_ID=MMETSP0359-20131031/66669_1 /ASSEMBLY_ACC=CAM_ASM_000338 /TAXON_ID=268821 /ORGANISM="Scrippsiella Hangoei, Strain SHTV-5" /LENGTH=807 /DNA_ID=CAMNT_0050855959 /DNA_START=1 /DNA_END=2421 /DNA_ORIENTATION=+
MARELSQCAAMLRRDQLQLEGLKEILHHIRRVRVTLPLLQETGVAIALKKWKDRDPLAKELLDGWRQMFQRHNANAAQHLRSGPQAAAPLAQRRPLQPCAPQPASASSRRQCMPARPGMPLELKWSNSSSPYVFFEERMPDGTELRLQVTESRAGSRVVAEDICAQCLQLMRNGGTKQDGEVLKTRLLTELAPPAPEPVRPSAGPVEFSDAPRGHKAWEKVRVAHKGMVMLFKFRDENFQVTVRAAGSVAEAKRIARLCYLRFEAGDRKADILEFRNEMLRRSTADGADPEAQRQFDRKECDSEERFVEDMVEGHFDHMPDPPAHAADTQNSSRWDLPEDSPIRPQHRGNYIFVAEARKSIKDIALGRFTSDVARMAPLEEWKFETECDLCGQAKSGCLYKLRCYARGQARPRRMHIGIFYAGPKCAQKMLGDFSSMDPSRALKHMLESEDWETQLNQLVTQCRSQHMKDLVMGMVRRLQKSASKQVREATRGPVLLPPVRPSSSSSSQVGGVQTSKPAPRKVSADELRGRLARLEAVCQGSSVASASIGASAQTWASTSPSRPDSASEPPSSATQAFLALLRQHVGASDAAQKNTDMQASAGGSSGSGRSTMAAGVQQPQQSQCLQTLDDQQTDSDDSSSSEGSDSSGSLTMGESSSDDAVEDPQVVHETRSIAWSQMLEEFNPDAELYEAPSGIVEGDESELNGGDDNLWASIFGLEGDEEEDLPSVAAPQIEAQSSSVPRAHEATMWMPGTTRRPAASGDVWDRDFRIRSGADTPRPDVFYPPMASLPTIATFRQPNSEVMAAT